MNAEDVLRTLYDMTLIDASKEDLYSVITSYHKLSETDEDEAEDGEENATTNNALFRSPLNTMNTEQRCRWFANALMELPGIRPGTTEYEEAKVFEDAADKLRALKVIIQSF